MPHPPDPALSRAVARALRQLRAAGWNTRDLAGALGVGDPTVIRWENGRRVPALQVLALLDGLLGRRRGYVLWLAGYVADEPAKLPESAPR